MEFLFSLLICLALPLSFSDRGVVPGHRRSERHAGEAPRDAAPERAWTAPRAWGSPGRGRAILSHGLDLAGHLGLPSACLPWGYGFYSLFQSSEGASAAQQQAALLDLQSALFCSQLEIQKLQRGVRQKERQLADAERRVQFAEAAAREREQQREASWQHSQVNH